MPAVERMLLDAVQGELIAAGLARHPSTSGSAPPVWVEPPGGPPAPGEKKGTENDTATMLSLVMGPEVLGGGRWQRELTVDVWFRTAGSSAAPRAYDTEQAIRDHLLGTDEFRTDFLLAPGTPQELRVIEATLWAGMRPINSEPDPPRYTYLVTYRFQVYRTGEPGG